MTNPASLPASSPHGESTNSQSPPQSKSVPADDCPSDQSSSSSTTPAVSPSTLQSLLQQFITQSSLPVSSGATSLPQPPSGVEPQSQSADLQQDLSCNDVQPTNMLCEQNNPPSSTTFPQVVPQVVSGSSSPSSFSQIGSDSLLPTSSFSQVVSGSLSSSEALPVTVTAAQNDGTTAVLPVMTEEQMTDQQVESSADVSQISQSVAQPPPQPMTSDAFPHSTTTTSIASSSASSVSVPPLSSESTTQSMLLSILAQQSRICASLDQKLEATLNHHAQQLASISAVLSQYVEQNNNAALMREIQLKKSLELLGTFQRESVNEWYEQNPILSSAMAFSQLLDENNNSNSTAAASSKQHLGLLHDMLMPEISRYSLLTTVKSMPSTAVLTVSQSQAIAAAKAAAAAAARNGTTTTAVADATTDMTTAVPTADASAQQVNVEAATKRGRGRPPKRGRKRTPAPPRSTNPDPKRRHRRNHVELMLESLTPSELQLQNREGLDLVDNDGDNATAASTAAAPAPTPAPYVSLTEWKPPLHRGHTSHSKFTGFVATTPQFKLSESGLRRSSRRVSKPRSFAEDSEDEDEDDEDDEDEDDDGDDDNNQRPRRSARRRSMRKTPRRRSPNDDSLPPSTRMPVKRNRNHSESDSDSEFDASLINQRDRERARRQQHRGMSSMPQQQESQQQQQEQGQGQEQDSALLTIDNNSTSTTTYGNENSNSLQEQRQQEPHEVTALQTNNPSLLVTDPANTTTITTTDTSLNSLLSPPSASSVLDAGSHVLSPAAYVPNQDNGFGSFETLTTNPSNIFHILTGGRGKHVSLERQRFFIANSKLPTATVLANLSQYFAKHITMTAFNPNTYIALRNWYVDLICAETLAKPVVVTREKKFELSRTLGISSQALHCWITKTNDALYNLTVGMLSQNQILEIAQAYVAVLDDKINESHPVSNRNQIRALQRERSDAVSLLQLVEHAVQFDTSNESLTSYD